MACRSETAHRAPRTAATAGFVRGLPNRTTSPDDQRRVWRMSCLGAPHPSSSWHRDPDAVDGVPLQAARDQRRGAVEARPRSALEDRRPPMAVLIKRTGMGAHRLVADALPAPGPDLAADLPPGQTEAIELPPGHDLRLTIGELEGCDEARIVRGDDMGHAVMLRGPTRSPLRHVDVWR